MKIWVKKEISGWYLPQRSSEETEDRKGSMDFFCRRGKLQNRRLVLCGRLFAAPLDPTLLAEGAGDGDFADQLLAQPPDGFEHFGRFHAGGRIVVRAEREACGQSGIFLFMPPMVRYSMYLWR